MATIGFEEKLWQAADKLRGSMDAAEYKNVALGIIFLKYVSDSFEEKYDELLNDEYADEEDKDEYLAENIFWVPKESRWQYINDNSKKPEIDQIIDKAMIAIEKMNHYSNHLIIAYYPYSLIALYFLHLLVSLDL